MPLDPEPMTTLWRVLVSRPSKRDELLRHLVARRFPGISDSQIDDFLEREIAVVATDLLQDEAHALVQRLLGRDIIATAEVPQGNAEPATVPPNKMSGAAHVTPVPGTTANPDTVRQEAQRLLRAGKKIQAIKLVRDHTHIGLKEAKEYVEALESGRVHELGAPAGPGRFRRCLSCQGIISILDNQTSFTCPWCGSKGSIPWFSDAQEASATAVDYTQGILARGADLERGDVLISGFTIVGGYGWAPPAGTKITVAVCADHLTIARVPYANSSLLQIPYDKLIGLDFQGGARTTGGGLVGGGFGVKGAVEGMLVASVLNSLTSKTTINTVVRISAVDGELYVHHGGEPPEALRILLGPAVNAVQVRDRERARSKTVGAADDSVERLEKLAMLHKAGALTDDEFRIAKQKILGGAAEAAQRRCIRNTKTI